MSIKEKFLYNNLYLTSQPFFREKFKGNKREFEKKLYNYISKILKIKYPSQEFKLKNSKRHSIAQMASPPLALNFYKFLCGLKKPKRILEIGSFIGYSTLFLAKSTNKDCKVYTIEKFKEFLEIAKLNFKKNNLDKKIKIINGEAQEVLKKYKNLKFDFVFLDGDKGNYLKIFKLIENKHLMKGSVIIVDNFFFHGDVLNKTKSTKGRGVYNLGNYLQKSNKYIKSILPIYDGIMLLIKK